MDVYTVQILYKVAAEYEPEKYTYVNTVELLVDDIGMIIGICEKIPVDNYKIIPRKINTLSKYVQYNFEVFGDRMSLEKIKRNVKII
jgi:hypothetical protein